MKLSCRLIFISHFPSHMVDLLLCPPSGMLTKGPSQGPGGNRARSYRVSPKRQAGPLRYTNDAHAAEGAPRVQW